jgi:hypothetical protein
VDARRPLGPEDVPRAPSGRIPQWVLHERAARDAPPIAPPRRRRRSHSLRTADRRRSRSRGSGSWLPATLAVVVAVGAGVLAVGSGHLPEAPQAFGDNRPGNIPKPGFEEADGPVGKPGPAASSTAFGFSVKQADGSSPVSYDPCRPIHYVIRPDGAPAGGDALIAAALAKASAASGFRFVNDGPTTEGASEQRSAYQPERYGDRWAPVLFVWETANEQPDFGVDVAGLGGSSPVSWGDHPHVFVTGAVQLDASKLGAMLAQPKGPLSVQAVIMHEVGHVLGLAHVNDPDQLMYPRGSHVTDYGPGDLAGLARLGAGTCAPWL